MNVLIIGAGYVGGALAGKLQQEGHEVHVFQRHPPQGLEHARINFIAGDISRPGDLQRLPLALDWVVNTVSAGGGGEESYRQVYYTGTRHLIEALLKRPPAKYVYTSSTGVYGQNEGEEVNEQSLTRPENETGRILLETEELLLDAHRSSGFPCIILRVAGIYGPERGYWLRQFLAGQAILEGDGSRYLNMVHRDDVVGAIMAALKKGQAGQVYNLVDHEPVTQKMMFEWLAQRLDRPMPQPAPVIVPRKRAVSNKRVLNDKLRKHLGYEFVFPTFREGFNKELLG